MELITKKEQSTCLNVWLQHWDYSRPIQPKNFTGYWRGLVLYCYRDSAKGAETTSGASPSPEIFGNISRLRDQPCEHRHNSFRQLIHLSQQPTPLSQRRACEAKPYIRHNQIEYAILREHFSRHVCGRRGVNFGDVADSPQAMSTAEQQQKASQEIRNVVNFLRSSKAGLKNRVGVLNGKRIDYFKGECPTTPSPIPPHVHLCNAA